MSLQVPTGLSRLVCFIYLLIVLLPEITDAETVKVSTTPLVPGIPWENQQDDFEVLVRVEAPPAPSRRAPVDLVAVLDLSSSMNKGATTSGESRLDLLKRAMRFIISKLESGDRLAIVAFNETLVEEYGTGLLDMSPEGRGHIKRRVKQLTAQGDTAFWPGLDKAVKILDERTDGRNRAGFILLLSDGKDRSGIRWSTAGISNEMDIRAALPKYPVHAFGFTGFHDPSALRFIAQESQGTFSFVNENLDMITGAFAVCLGGLKTIVAVDTRITLTAPKHRGVQINSIQSGGYVSHVSDDRASGRIVIGVLYAGEVKNFIVRLHVPEIAVSEQQQQQLLLDLVTAARYLHTRAAAVSSSAFEEIDTGTSLSLHRPNALAVQQQVRSPLVVSHIVRFKLVELVVRFVQCVDKVAVATIDSVKADELANKLQLKWEEFKEAQNIKLFSGVDVWVWRLEADIKDMVIGLRHGGVSGVAFIYSWVSSHQMQRATTMGSPEKVVSEFLTLEMEAMLKEAQTKPLLDEDPFLLQPPTSEPYWEYPPRGIVDDDIKEPVSPGGCGRCVHGLDETMIDRRLQLWWKLKRELPLMFRTSEDANSRNLAALFQKESLQAIDHAMHQEVYLAVVHESNMRQCYYGRAGREAATRGHWSSEQRREYSSNAAAY